jgi:hypothetical protein
MEKEGSVEGVKEEVGEMETGGMEPPEMAIECEREPVERAVGGAGAGGGAELGGEGDGRGKEAGEDVVPGGEVGVANDLVEVVVDEGSLKDSSIEDEHPGGDDKEPDPAGEGFGPVRRRRWTLCGSLLGHGLMIVGFGLMSRGMDFLLRNFVASVEMTAPGGGE